MSLAVGQKSKKSLEVRAERKSFTNPETKVTKEYNSYYVVVNGIPITLQVPVKDNTARLILEEYFNE